MISLLNVGSSTQFGHSVIPKVGLDRLHAVHGPPFGPLYPALHRQSLILSDPVMDAK